jgi:hypothetical protein
MGMEVEYWKLIQNPTDFPPAPEKLLNIITCNFKTSCNTNNKERRRTGLQCSILCGTCQEIYQNINFQDISDKRDD